MLSDAHVATRIPVRDLGRAREWYSAKLGLEPSEERPGGLLYRLASGEFGLARRSVLGGRGGAVRYQGHSRREAKNARSRSAPSSASRPPATSGRWLRRGSASMSSTLPAAPAFGSGAA